MPSIHLIVLKVAGPCNLNCSYCYVYNARDFTYRQRPAFLSEDLARATMLRLRQYCSNRNNHRISICLHGGEPLLLGQQRFQALVELIRAELGPYLGVLTVQTNGVLIDQGWAALLRRLDVGVSVSLDGPPEITDSVRVDHAGRGTHARIVSGIRSLQREGVPVSVLAVVKPGASGRDVYHHLRSLDLTSLDFLLPDVSHDDWSRLYGGYGAAPAADYLISALDAWLQEDNTNIHVWFFADIFKLLLGERCGTDAYGGGEMSYLIVETDGSIQVNDALRVCEESLNDTGLNIATNDFDQLELARPHIGALIKGLLPLPDDCRECKEKATCGGGYMPHRYSREKGFNNPSVWCADTLQLFGHMRQILDKTACASHSEVGHD